jgi:hypothetical protein
MHRALAIAALMLGACHAFAQTPAPRPEFQVASTKLNKSENRNLIISPYPGARFTARNASIEAFQVSGALARLTAERYDVEAKADGNPDFAAP